jgi:23S rRNA G2445 N2-methylase RlmL
MTRLATEIARSTGLREVAEEGDLLIRLRRSEATQGDGWEALARAAPKPLATRDWRVCNVEGSLQATVGHAMALLTQPRATDVYLNLGCGSGTLLFERASAGPARRLIGCDSDPIALDCAQRNAASPGGRPHARRIELEQWDATELPLRDASVDALAADLPFGHRVGSHGINEALYPATLIEAARVAKPGARFVAITAELRLIDRVLRESAAPWSVDRTMRVNLGGLRPMIYVLAKRTTQ